VKRLCTRRSLRDRRLVEHGQAEGRISGDEAMLGRAQRLQRSYPRLVRRLIVVLLGCLSTAGVLAAVSSGHGAGHRAAGAHRTTPAHRSTPAIPHSLLALIESRLHTLAAPHPTCSFDTGMCGCTLPVSGDSSAPATPGQRCQPSNTGGPCMLLVASASTLSSSSSSPGPFCKPRELQPHVGVAPRAFAPLHRR
jgi:hypothetical protein